MTLKVLWLWGHLFLVRGGKHLGHLGHLEHLGHLGHLRFAGIILGNHWKSFLRVILVNYSFCRSSLFAKSFLCGLRFSACALVPYLPCALSCAPCLSCFAYLACIVYVPCTTSLPHALFFTPYPSLHFGVIDNQ